MAGLWHEISVAEELATAGSGAANAAYFAGRAFHAGGPRRVAALVLLTLFAGTAIDAAAQIAVGESGALAAAVRLPLLLANLATFTLILSGAGR